MMKRWHVLKRLLPLLAGVALLLSACGRADLSTLNPQGPVAQSQFDLMKLSISIMILVVVVVFAIAIYVLIRFRRRPGNDKIPVQVEGNHKLEIIWTVIPLILLVILGIPTIQTVFALAEDYSRDENAVVVKVTSHLYWWEFEYPQHGVVTAQELVIPTNAKIAIEAKTADVLHSFWIPALAGKIDTNPGGNVNRMFFEAPKPGIYYGKCAELCGPSHALMDFKVKAVEPASFENWVNAMKAPAQLPSDPEIAEVFQSECLSCHAVGELGGPAFPNLTGIGSRESVAGILLNTEDPEYENEGTTYENLYRWIQDPQAIKPGNAMPKVDLTEEELEGIARYLSELKLEGFDPAELQGNSVTNDDQEKQQ
ncbi:cytochrome c oxidase subunit II [Paenibacillus tarimensis]|uniref:cytochrome c oxidase subunit II n=1 Tax=Paenibacillus tarimensis TaxID=416012 RepID=UPI001F2E4963|nr:cytochrome c oxidase subunit II [Paenibacillus tarimensis]MCF2943436.1 cytochrome c oxidase subunit II [Paenibacillus tarimensis]